MSIVGTSRMRRMRKMTPKMMRKRTRTRREMTVKRKERTELMVRKPPFLIREATPGINPKQG